MKIFIVANFTSIGNEPGNCRFCYLADMLSKKHEVTLLTSSFCHSKKTQRPNTKWHKKYAIKLIREPGYKKNISIRRFISHILWGINVAKYVHNNMPDTIYCAVPSLTAAYLLSKICAKNKVHFVIDVQDLWPDAFKMVFRTPVLSDIIYLPFNTIAKSIYRSTNNIITVSETYTSKIKKINKNAIIHTVYLGTDKTLFDDSVKKYKNKNPIRSVNAIEGPHTLAKGQNELWLAYCGTLGASYDIGTMIKAISQLKLKNVKILIIGDGPLRGQFIKMAQKYGVDADFTGRISYDKMCELLTECDIALNPITPGAAGSIINKHADYTAAGLPIISTQDNQEFIDLIKKYGMGINCSSNDMLAIEDSIMQLLNSPKLRKKMAKKSRRCFERLFDRQTTYKQIINTIDELGVDNNIPRVQVLLSTMNRKEPELLIRKCNISTPYVIVNQTNGPATTRKEGRSKIIININDRGLSKSRNLAKRYANEEICAIADDDIVYVNNYEKIITDAYKKYPDADIIAFNLNTNTDYRRPTRQRNGRVSFLKSLKIQSTQITFKKDFMERNSITFNENFGAGSKDFTSGEENILLADCLRKGAKIYYCEKDIASIDHKTSTWFHGYDEKYFRTKGAVFYAIDKKLSILLIFQFAIRKIKLYEAQTSFTQAIRFMLLGRKQYKKQRLQ